MPRITVDSAVKPIPPATASASQNIGDQNVKMRMSMTKVTLVKPMLRETPTTEHAQIKAGTENEDAKTPGVPIEVIGVRQAVAVIAQEETTMNGIPANEPVINEPGAVANGSLPGKAKSVRPKVGRPAHKKTVAEAEAVAPKVAKPRKKKSKEKEATAALATEADTQAVSAQETVKPDLAADSPSGASNTKPPVMEAPTADKNPTIQRLEIKTDKPGIADRIQINQLQKELARIELAKDLAEDAKVRRMDLKFTVFVVVLFAGVMLGLAALINNHKTQSVIVSTPQSETGQEAPAATEPKTALEPLDRPANSDAAAPQPAQGDSTIIQPAPATMNQPALDSSAATVGATVASPAVSTVPTAVTPVASAVLAPISAAAQSPSAATTAAPATPMQDKAAQSQNLLSILNRE